MSTFLGSHPRNAQVPPNGLESTIATCHPASRQRDATDEAADPVPIAITSNFLVIMRYKPQDNIINTLDRSEGIFKMLSSCRMRDPLPGIGFHWMCHPQDKPQRQRSLKAEAPCGHWTVVRKLCVQPRRL